MTYILKNCRAEGCLFEWEYLILDSFGVVVESFVCLPAEIYNVLDQKFPGEKPQSISPHNYKNLIKQQKI